MTIVTIKHAGEMIVELLNADIPSFTWGPPGVGKSDLVHQVAKKLGIGLIDFRATLRDAVDLRGLPSTDTATGTTRWLAPDELPRVDRDGEAGILFMDELNAAPLSVQAACFGLVLERRLGEYKLPEKWIPIAAGNRVKDKAAAQRMPTALKNRFAHIEVEANLDDWTAWAAGAAINPIVPSFVRFRPKLLHVMPEDDTHNAFPTPRAWEKVARIVETPNKVIRQHLIASIVGEGPASEMESFLRVYMELPTLDEIIRDPKKTRVPKEEQAGHLYAIAGMLGRRSNRDNFEKVITYAKRMPKEFEICVVTDSCRFKPDLANTGAFAKWAVDNQDVTL